MDGSSSRKWKPQSETTSSDEKPYLYPVVTARFSDSGNFIFTGSADNSVRLWRYSDARLRGAYGRYIDPDYDLRDACLSKDDSKLSICCADGKIMCYDIVTGAIRRLFNAHENGVNAVKFNEFGDVIASADSCVRLWDCRSHSNKPIQIFETFTDSVSSLHLTRMEIMAGSLDGTIQEFDLRKKKHLSHNLGAPVKSIFMSDRYMLASCVDSTIRYLQVDTAFIKSLGTYSGHTCQSAKLGCCFTPGGSVVVGGSDDGHIFFWNLMSGGVVSKLKAHSSAVTSVEYHPTDDCMVSASMDGSFFLWKEVM